MAQIANYSAIFVIIVFIFPACSPAIEIKTEPDNAPQQSKIDLLVTSTNLDTDLPSDTPVPLEEDPSLSAVTTAVDPENTVESNPGSANLSSLQVDLSSLYEQSSPGVVTVMSDEIEGVSLSSGFFIDRDGNIATSFHGVKTESGLTVRTSTGETIPAVMVGKDPDADLAILNVDLPPEKITPLPLGVSDDLRVGQLVATIGIPFGLEGSMTTGIVSGIGQGLRYLRRTLGEDAVFPGEVILTDAAVNPGNSGGPLLNLAGEVIGINTTVITSGDGGQLSGMSLALPIDVAKPIITALVEQGIYEYPYLGFSSVDELTVREREALALTNGSGIYITRVEQGGPADRAGLKAGEQETVLPGMPAGGDLIIAVDGHPLDRYDQLFAYLIKHKSPGDTVILSVVRAGELKEIAVQLVSSPDPVDQDW